MTIKAGHWLVDPEDLTISGADATTLSDALTGGASVTLETTSTTPSETGVTGLGATSNGAGDIIIASPVGWDSTATLTLDAYHSIAIDAPITVSGAGALVLDTNDHGGSGGALSFAYGPAGFAGNVAFTDVVGGATQGSLTINGNAYTLENSVAGLASDIAANPGGFYALANSYDATNDGTYGSAPIPTSFTGTFEGLGNAISNLTIFANTAPADEGIGLFASVTGNISDLALSGGSLTGNANVGALAGFDGGDVNNVHSSMAVTGFFFVGGLIGEFGEPGRALANSSSTGAVTGELVDSASSGEPSAIGGLIGQLDAGSVTASYATGAVTALGGDQIGGLIGITNGNNNVVVSNSYATGAVDAGVSPSLIAGVSVGGLIGDNGGAVIDSYATGAVLGTQNVGGLIGINETDAPGTNATNPTGDGTVVNAYATGAVTGYVDSFGNEGIDVGGLIGYNLGGVAGVYATGAVIGGDQLGGLVGTNEGSLTSVYSTGLVRAAAGATPTEIGGLVGEDDSGGDFQNAYWDTLTSGQPTVGVGSGAVAAVAGFTTAQLQSTATTGITLGAAFAGGAAGGEDGVYPYLVDFFPNGVQAVSGFAYSDAGATALTGTAIGVVAGGVGLGQATTGANGYYYVYTAAGAVPNGANVLAYGSNAATLATSAGDNNTGGVDLYGQAVTVPTTAATLSTVPTLTQAQATALAADGGVAAAAAAINGATGQGFVTSASSFTVDQPLTTSATFFVQTTAGAPITVARSITVNGTGSIGLDAAGAMAINAPVSVTGGETVALTAAGENDGGSTLDPFLTVAQGDSISFAAGSGEGIAGQALSIEGAPYTLLYSMSDVAAINGGSGYVALATSLDASATTYPSAVVGAFSGRFEGLGNTISGLTIGDTVGNGNDGLFGRLNSGGIIRDIGLADVSITAADGSADVGSLVGVSDGAILQSFATGGAVSAGNASLAVGGLVGDNEGAIQLSFATNAVLAGANAEAVGGLAGYNAGTIQQAFAMGAVAAGSSSDGVGGLVGENAGAIGHVYATGAVSALFSSVGGVVGHSRHGATLTDGYWDRLTSGVPLDSGGAALLFTGALQSAATTGVNLGSAFAGGAAGGEDGVYPYLVNFFPNGVQAVSGIAYSDRGVTALASGANGAVTVGVVAGGVSLDPATTGANGYYYVFTAAGGAPNGASVLAYGANAATFVTSAGVNNTGGVNLYGSALIDTTSEVTYSAALSDVNAAAGGNAAALAAIAGATNTILTATGPHFRIDQPVTTSGYFDVTSTASSAPITVADTVTVGGSGSLTLAAAGALAIDAPVSVTGAGTVTLNAATQSIGGVTQPRLSFGVSGDISYAAGTGEGIPGQALTVNGTPYTLLYSMSDVGGINGQSGDYALATNLTASSTYSGAVVGSFSGTFEGLGNTITGLTINDTSNDAGAGLFGTLSAAGVIRDLGLASASVSTSGSPTWTGGLVGVNYGTIIAVTVSGNVSGTAGVGGLAGYNDGTISNSVAGVGTVSGANEVGGLVGGNDSGGLVTGSSSSETVNADGYAIGGLVGFNVGAVTGGSSASGQVTGGMSWTGGLVGVNEGTISAASASGNVSGNEGVGGLAGYNVGTITNAATSSGMVNAFAAAGGLVGVNDETGVITGSSSSETVNAVSFTAGGLVGWNEGGTITGGSSASGNVSGNLGVGGLAGENDGTIDGGASASGNVSGNVVVGGLVGYNNATISNATSSVGTVSGASEEIGGLVGYNDSGGLITGSSSSETVSVGSSVAAVGGLVGWNAGGVITGASSASGQVTGGTWVGGLAGVNEGTISGNSSASGNVSGVVAVGGLAGYNDATITDASASSGTVSGPTYIGGLVGYNDISGQISGSVSSETVNSGSSGVATGGLVGYSDGTISGAASSASGQVTGGIYTGGLVGVNFGTIANVTASGNASGELGVGGLAGYNNGTISNAVASVGTVSGADEVGGLVGGNDSGGLITGSSSSETINANGYAIGGLVGYNLGTVTGGSSASGQVNGWTWTGGLVGVNRGTIEAASASGDVSGDTGVGGLVGYNDATINTAAAAGGTVSASSEAGGLVGFNDAGGVIQDTYATDAVGAGTDTGGLVGYARGSISASWSSGAVVSGTTSAGLIGFADGLTNGPVTLTNLYWDEGASGQTTGVAVTNGAVNQTSVTGIGGLTGLSPTAQSTYVGFDFTHTWTIVPGVSPPTLQALGP